MGADVPFEIADAPPDRPDEALIEAVIRPVVEKGEWLMNEISRRATIGVERASRWSPVRVEMNSSTRERALACASAVPAARRWRIQPKP